MLHRAPHAQLQRTCGRGLVGGRHRAFDQPHRQVDEDAGRCAVAALDPAAIGLPVAVQVALHLAQGRAVGPAGMAIDPAQPDGPVGERGIQHRGAREGPARPQVLVPAAADDPAVCAGQGGGERLEPRHHVRFRRRADQVGGQFGHAQPADVAVGVDQAGNDGCAGEIGDGRLRIPRAQGGGVAHGQDPARFVVHQRGRQRLRRIHGVDARRGHQGVGGVGRPRHGQAHGQNQLFHRMSSPSVVTVPGSAGIAMCRKTCSLRRAASARSPMHPAAASLVLTRA